jgi:hypothetical protein
LFGPSTRASDVVAVISTPCTIGYSGVGYEPSSAKGQQDAGAARLQSIGRFAMLGLRALPSALRSLT